MLVCLVYFAVKSKGSHHWPAQKPWPILEHVTMALFRRDGCGITRPGGCIGRVHHDFTTWRILGRIDHACPIPWLGNIWASLNPLDIAINLYSSWWWCKSMYIIVHFRFLDRPCWGKMPNTSAAQQVPSVRPTSPHPPWHRIKLEVPRREEQARQALAESLGWTDRNGLEVKGELKLELRSYRDLSSKCGGFSCQTSRKNGLNNGLKSTAREKVGRWIWPQLNSNTSALSFMRPR
jgi:hypothetical protein